jgi:hypothetical protein
MLRIKGLKVRRGSGIQAHRVHLSELTLADVDHSNVLTVQRFAQTLFGTQFFASWNNQQKLIRTQPLQRAFAVVFIANGPTFGRGLVPIGLSAPVSWCEMQSQNTLASLRQAEYGY